MPIEYYTAGVMLLSLIVYVLLGGADFGGGVWDLLAWGPRRAAMRDAVASAIGPIWEANHVWLILLVVLLFTGFPGAFAAVSIALHVPMLIMLLGIVARGTAFTFRAYDQPGRHRERWGLLFSVASAVTPVMLGVILGTAASGVLEWDEVGYRSGWFAPWLRPWPWMVGLFTTSICAMLAAAYLCVETAGPLREDFRRAALAAWAAVTVTGVITWIMARWGAPHLAVRLAEHDWSWPVRGGTALLALAGLAALVLRRFKIARACLALEVVLIVLGFGLAIFPMIVVRQFTVDNTAAPAITHRLLLIGLGAGSLILVPSLIYLMRVFKVQRSADGS